MSLSPISPRRHRKRAAATLRWLVVAAYFSLFSLLLLLPNPMWLFGRLGSRAASWWEFDYVTPLSYAVHCGGFGLLVLLLIWVSPTRGTARYVWPAAAVVLYGTLIELIQIPIPHRAFELLDIAANAAGCVVAAGLGLLYRRRGRATVPSAVR